jgi:hypothetical protein
MNIPYLAKYMKAIFRVFPPSADDLLSTAIKIEKNQMERLGIKTGEIVQVTGARITAATCLQLEDGFSIPSDPDMTYLENTSTLPQARPGGITMENLNHHRMAGLGPIQIEKVQSGVAERISLVKVTNPKSGKTEFDKTWLFGLVVSKDDRIYFRNEDYQMKFGCVVKDVQPEGFCVIDKDTLLEFSEDSPRPRGIPVNRGNLNNLTKVISISRQIKTDMFTLTVPSLEIYDEGLRCYLYIRGRYGANMQFMHSHVTPDVRVSDDLGNIYSITVNGGGGSSGPDGFDCKWDVLIPPTNADAKELTLAVQEIRWQGSMENPQMRHTRDMRKGPSMRSRANRRPRYSEIEKFPPLMIYSGPWEIKIPL